MALTPPGPGGGPDMTVVFLLCYAGAQLLLHLEAGERPVAMPIEGRKRAMIVASRAQMVGDV
jgi:hypothetical protein